MVVGGFTSGSSNFVMTKTLSAQQEAEHRAKGLCFFCHEDCLEENEGVRIETSLAEGGVVQNKAEPFDFPSCYIWG